MQEDFLDQSRKSMKHAVLLTELEHHKEIESAIEGVMREVTCIKDMWLIKAQKA